MKTICLSLLMSIMAGCHQSPEQECVSVALRVGKRSENCGVAISVSSDVAKKQCAEMSDSDRRAWINDMRYISNGETCAAMHLRAMELARKAMKTVDAEAEKQADEESGAAFSDAFKKAFEEAQKQQAEQSK